MLQLLLVAAVGNNIRLTSVNSSSCIITHYCIAMDSNHGYKRQTKYRVHANYTKYCCLYDYSIPDKSKQYAWPSFCNSAISATCGTKWLQHSPTCSQIIKCLDFFGENIQAIRYCTSLVAYYLPLWCELSLTLKYFRLNNQKTLMDVHNSTQNWMGSYHDPKRKI